MDLDRNLLFGLRALQLGLIEATHFTDAYLLWRRDPLVSLPVEFVSRGWLTEEQRRAIEQELPIADTPSGSATPIESLPSTELRRVVAVLHDSARESGAPDPRHANETGAAPDAPRYARLALHGKGGIGQVWRGFDRVLERTIALKELRPDKIASTHNRERFLLEARLTAQLEHPGIVPVHELVQPDDGGPTFYTMRLIQGRTLAEAVHEYHTKRRQGQADLVELRELLQAYVTVCNTVAFAHHRGVIHRDLKGSNIILGSFGEVLVLDWGMAKRFAEPAPQAAPQSEKRAESELRTEPTDVSITESFAAKATRHGEVMGTPGYMAPEQAAGRVDQLDVRTDIYGLGAVLYHLLTDRAPVTGSSIEEVIQKTQMAPLLAPRRVEPTVPKPLEAICLKALARAREERYASALELANEVKRWLADEPVRVFRDSLTIRAGRWMRRHRTLVTSTFAVLVVALVLLGGASVLLNQAFLAEHDARMDQENQTKKARIAEESAKLAEKKAVDERDAAARAETAARAAQRQTELATVALVLATTNEKERPLETMALLDEATRGWVRVNPEHPMILVLLAHRAMQSKDDPKQLDQALELAAEVLKVRRFDQPLEDTLAIDAANSIGALYLKRERPKEAQRILAEVLRGRRKVLAANDPETLHAIYALGLAALLAEQFDAAAPLFAELLTPERRALLKRDRTARNLTYLGECQLRLRQYAAAETNLREARQTPKVDLTERWRYFNIQRLLATAILKQKRPKEAEPLLLEAYDGLAAEIKNNPYIRRVFLPEAIDSLVELYETTGQNVKAEQWKGKRSKEQE